MNNHGLFLLRSGRLVLVFDSRDVAWYRVDLIALRFEVRLGSPTRELMYIRGWLLFVLHPLLVEVDVVIRDVVDDAETLGRLWLFHSVLLRRCLAIF